MRKLRKTSPRSKRANPGSSEALKKKWQDPEFRARMAQRSTRAGKRTGVPDGMRAAEADLLWVQANEKADYIMSELEKEGVVAFAPNIPEDQMAKTALREAFVIAMSPLQAQTRLAAIRMVLEFTKSKPAAKTDLTLNSAEAWLKAVVEDHKSSE